MMTARSTSRSPTPRRRFRLADIVILISATAGGCAVSRGISSVSPRQLSWQALYYSSRALYNDGVEMIARSRTAAFILAIVYLLSELFVLTSPLVAFWTLALIPIRLLAPRPCWRRVARQPGIVAAWASLLSLTLVGLAILGRMLFSAAKGDGTSGLPVIETVYFSQLFVSVSILASWTTLLLGRSWRAETSWIDRLGRALAIWWIVAGLFVASTLVL